MRFGDAVLVGCVRVVVEVVLGDRLDHQVGDEADREHADHRQQRRPVVGGDQVARLADRVEDAVDDQRARDAGGRPGGQQAAVDGADLEGAEEVLEVGRDGREATAVVGDDHHRQGHEDDRARLLPNRARSR